VWKKNPILIKKTHQQTDLSVCKKESLSPSLPSKHSLPRCPSESLYNVPLTWSVQDQTGSFS